MCRVLAYLGQSILLEKLLFEPDNSLIVQGYQPKLMKTSFLNLAGFGFCAWDNVSPNKEQPFLYRTPELPFYNKNLKNLIHKIKAQCLISHIRGIEYSVKNIMSMENVHPFLFDNTSIAFAHNGDLVGFNEIRYDLANEMKQKYRVQIKGSTDSEWMYALFLSNLPARKKNYIIADVFDALFATFDILQFVRRKHGIHISSPLNFFISDGSFIVATRYVLDYGSYGSIKLSSPHIAYHSLWYTDGVEYGYFDHEYKMKEGKKRKSIIIASEPLTEDTTTWIELPEYSFIGAYIEEGKVQIDSIDIIF